MREIKFRAWNGFRQEMNTVLNIGWFEGIYMNISLDTEDGQVDYNDMPDNMECENIELMQYTGLKDKNGKEIYEGDVLRLKFQKNSLDIFAKVEYSTTYVQYIVTGTKTILYENEPLSDYEEIEVIGNIYDNPNLLKED